MGLSHCQDQLCRISVAQLEEGFDSTCSGSRSSSANFSTSCFLRNSHHSHNQRHKQVLVVAVVGLVVGLVALLMVGMQAGICRGPISSAREEHFLQ